MSAPAKRPFAICSNCMMDTSDSNILFDARGSTECSDDLANRSLNCKLSLEKAAATFGQIISL
jgi:hypothetical protein